ncbi:MAG: hypothetical protein KAR07_09910 [Spirochaetes bacterium]|nr:hypothetical protein [Spirochaetota bacterium]
MNRYLLTFIFIFMITSVTNLFPYSRTPVQERFKRQAYRLTENALVQINLKKFLKAFNILSQAINLDPANLQARNLYLAILEILLIEQRSITKTRKKIPLKERGVQIVIGKKWVMFSWVKIKNKKFKGIEIKRGTEDFPKKPSEGLSIYKGTNVIYIDKNLKKDKAYYYTLFVDYGSKRKRTYQIKTSSRLKMKDKKMMVVRKIYEKKFIIVRKYYENFSRKQLQVFLNPGIVFYDDAIGYSVDVGYKINYNNLFGSKSIFGQDLTLGTGLRFFYTPTDFDIALTSYGFFLMGSYDMYIFGKSPFYISGALHLGVSFGYFKLNNTEIVLQGAFTMLPSASFNFDAKDLIFGLNIGYDLQFGNRTVTGILLGLKVDYPL